MVNNGEFDEDIRDLYSNQHYMSVKGAVVNASKGQFPLDEAGLAEAIVSGLFDWGNQEARILKLLQEIAKHSQHPIKVEDLSEGR